MQLARRRRGCGRITRWLGVEWEDAHVDALSRRARASKTERGSDREVMVYGRGVNPVL